MWVYIIYVCMYLNIYIYVYIYIYIYIYIYVYIYLYIYLYIYCFHIHIYIYIYIYMCVCVYIYTYVHIFVHTSVEKHQFWCKTTICKSRIFLLTDWCVNRTFTVHCIRDFAVVYRDSQICGTWSLIRVAWLVNAGDVNEDSVTLHMALILIWPWLIRVGTNMWEMTYVYGGCDSLIWGTWMSLEACSWVALHTALIRMRGVTHKFVGRDSLIFRTWLTHTGDINQLRCLGNI